MGTNPKNFQPLQVSSESRGVPLINPRELTIAEFLEEPDGMYNFRDLEEGCQPGEWSQKEWLTMFCRCRGSTPAQGDGLHAHDEGEAFPGSIQGNSRQGVKMPVPCDLPGYPGLCRSVWSSHMVEAEGPWRRSPFIEKSTAQKASHWWGVSANRDFLKMFFCSQDSSES